MLSVEKLGRREGRLQILDGVGFDWPRGVLAIIGGNGTGKTTLLRVIAGAVKPDTGKVLWNGLPTSRAVRLKGRIGYGPQERNLDLAITLREFLGLCADLRGLSDRRARVAEVSEELGLARQLDERLANLFGRRPPQSDDGAGAVGRAGTDCARRTDLGSGLRREPPFLGGVPGSGEIRGPGNRHP